MALGSGARFVHEGKGRFCFTYCEVINWLSSQVDSCAFASDETVQELLKEMEDLFTARFGGRFFSDRLHYRPYDFTHSEGRQETRTSSPTHCCFSQDTSF